MGPLGGIHNLDVLADSDDDLFPLLNAGDLVNFRLIQPVAVQIKKAPIAKVQANPMAKSQPLLSDAVTERGSLKAELLESFEITKVAGTVQRIRPAEKVLELRTPYDHDMLITSGVDLSTAGIKVGDEVTVELLDGLVVDLRKSSRKAFRELLRRSTTNPSSNSTVTSSPTLIPAVDKSTPLVINISWS